MKRTPLTRKTPLKRGGRPKTRSTTKRSMGKADPRWRSRAYLEWVKTLPCCHCGRPADDPHHAIGLGGLSGVGLTAPDQWVMPLCRRCHDEVHETPDLWPLQWRWVARTLALAVARGVLSVEAPS